MPNRIATRRLLAALVLAAGLSSCGQKGELYLEPEDPVPAGQEAQEDDGEDETE